MNPDKLLALVMGEGSEMRVPLTHLDLFSGIGGFALAARWTGQIETVAFCEIDPFCQKVLKKHWSDVEIISDIREVTGEKIRRIIADAASERLEGNAGTNIQDGRGGGLAESNQSGERIREIVANTECGRCDRTGISVQSRQQGQESAVLAGSYIDILTGGFPCQPFSCAGKREGTADNRFLWPEMLRVIREVRPTWVIGENVGGLLSIGDGMVFEDCCSSLEAEGYEVQPFVIPACGIGAPHRRDRVWIVAHSRRAHGKRVANGREPAGQIPCQEDATLLERSISHAPDPHIEGLQGRDEYGECAGERATWQGYTEQWEEDWYSVALRTCIRGMDDGLPPELDEPGGVPGEPVAKRKKKTAAGRVHRLRALGNAIVPQVAYQIMQAILHAEKEAK